MIYQPTLRKSKNCIEVIGGRVHNLQNINVTLQHKQLIAVLGISGSGKSSLVFSLLYKEAQLRYLSMLESSFVRNFIDGIERPDVDQVNGLQAAIGIGQEIYNSRTSNSTVGTVTDIYAFLRLLYARIGQAYSDQQKAQMKRQKPEDIAHYIQEHLAGERLTFIAPLVIGRKGIYKKLFNTLRKQGYQKVITDGTVHPLALHFQLDRYKQHDIAVIIAENMLIGDQHQPNQLQEIILKCLEKGKGNFYVQKKDGTKQTFSQLFMNLNSGVAYQPPSPHTFSFNSSRGACVQCQGKGTIQHLDIKRLIIDHNLSIVQGAIPFLTNYRGNYAIKKVEEFLRSNDYTLKTPLKELPPTLLKALIHGGTYQKRTMNFSLFDFLRKKVNPHGSQESDPIQIITCPSCQGQRLHQEALSFRIHKKNIAEICEMEITTLVAWIEALPQHLTERQNKIASNLLDEVRKRLKLLLEMKLGYLSLHRTLATLSGGEIRRLRIASQIGTRDTHLVGVMYILDEPSIGLHARDVQNLIGALKRLRNLGNTVIVIAHDIAIMREADYLLEIGPGAGRHGGKITAQGNINAFLQQKSITADFLTGKRTIPIPTHRRKGNSKTLNIHGCQGNTLKNINFQLPLGTFSVLTGVSGSGKSSLLHATLVPIVKRHLRQLHHQPLPYKNATGLEHINKIVEVTQAPIGRTYRSNVVTYTQLFEFIRVLFSQVPEAKIRGYKVQRFSFNLKGGRCETCKGVGTKLLEMEFLPSVRIPCEICEGRQYTRETLEILYKGKSIADILGMTIEEASLFFVHHPPIMQRLKMLEAVGLGYIKLGQHTSTLSGGEAQRLKLASELHKKDTGNTLYLLDEPTIGLHFEDIKHLLAVINALVERGNTVLSIAHHLDFIKSADYIIDLGPGSAAKGGYKVAEGSPEQVAQEKSSYTGQFLQKMLNTRML